MRFLTREEMYGPRKPKKSKLPKTQLTKRQKVRQWQKRLDAGFATPNTPKAIRKITQRA